MFTKYTVLSMALATLAAAQSDSSTSNPRIIVDSSTVTSVYTPVATATNVVYSTTSLPHSLDTVTSVNTDLITSTSLSTNVYTTNTLSNSATHITTTTSVTSPAAAASSSAGTGNMLKAGCGVFGAALLGAAAIM